MFFMRDKVRITQLARETLLQCIIGAAYAPFAPYAPEKNGQILDRWEEEVPKLRRERRVLEQKIKEAEADLRTVEQVFGVLKLLDAAAARKYARRK